MRDFYHHIVLLVILMLWGLGIAENSAHAQNRLRLSTKNHPAVSPYLFRGGGQTFSQNFFQTVRPRQQQLRLEQEQLVFNNKVWQGVNKNRRSTFPSDRNHSSETSGATGVRSTFFNLSHFFPDRTSDSR